MDINVIKYIFGPVAYEEGIDLPALDENGLISYLEKISSELKTRRLAMSMLANKHKKLTSE